MLMWNRTHKQRVQVNRQLHSRPIVPRPFGSGVNPTLPSAVIGVSCEDNSGIQEEPCRYAPKQVGYKS